MSPRRPSRNRAAATCTSPGKDTGSSGSSCIERRSSRSRWCCSRRYRCSSGNARPTSSNCPRSIAPRGSMLRRAPVSGCTRAPSNRRSRMCPSTARSRRRRRRWRLASFCTCLPRRCTTSLHTGRRRRSSDHRSATARGSKPTPCARPARRRRGAARTHRFQNQDSRTALRRAPFRRQARIPPAYRRPRRVLRPRRHPFCRLLWTCQDCSPLQEEWRTEKAGGGRIEGGSPCSREHAPVKKSHSKNGAKHAQLRR